MISVGWNIRSFDTTKRERRKVLKRVINKLSGGDIILFHDASEQMVDMLKHLLNYLNDNNFRVVNLKDLKLNKT